MESGCNEKRGRMIVQCRPSPKSMMHITYSQYLNKYKFSPYFSKIYKCSPYVRSIYFFGLMYVFWLPLYFDHDGIMLYKYCTVYTPERM